MKNKELIKILLNFPLNYDIKIEGKELFSIISDKSLKIDLNNPTHHGDIIISSAPNKIKDLPKNVEVYNQVYINKNEEFIIENKTITLDKNTINGLKFNVK